MNILVTGGCGFQGSHLVEALVDEGHFVRILNTPSEHAKINAEKYLQHKNIEIVWGSVADRYLLEMCMKDVEKVFHLAAKINVDESIEKPMDFYDTNVAGTNMVLDKAYERRVPVIYASTCEVYGENVYGMMNVLESIRKYKPELNFISTAAVYGEGSSYKMNEWHPLQPASPYAASKTSADRLCYCYYKTYGLDIKIVRPFNIYGERQKRQGFGAVIPIFFEKAINNESLTIYGDGTQTRDYLHVSDVIQAYMIISEEKDFMGKTVNIGSGKETSINDIAHQILDITGKPRDSIRYLGSRKGEVNSFIADTTFIEQYGFKPKIEFNTGMKRYYEWRMGVG